MAGKDHAIEDNLEVPDEFICPLTMELMHDPVVSRYGHNYERDAILSWLAQGHTDCPLTRQPLRLRDLITNHTLRSRIQKWQVQNEQDVTVFLMDKKILGIVTLEENESETERSEEGDDDIVQVTRHDRPRRNRTHHRSRGFNILGRFTRPTRWLLWHCQHWPLQKIQYAKSNSSYLLLEADERLLDILIIYTLWLFYWFRLFVSCCSREIQYRIVLETSVVFDLVHVATVCRT